MTNIEYDIQEDDTQIKTDMDLLYKADPSVLRLVCTWLSVNGYTKALHEFTNVYHKAQGNYLDTLESDL